MKHGATIRSNYATSVNIVVLSLMNSHLKAQFYIGQQFKTQRHISPKH